MKTPGTLDFVLTHHGGEFIVGAVLGAFSLYQLYNFEGDPESLTSKGIASGAAMFGQPVYWLGAVVGVGLALWAWHKGSKLRNGN